MSVSASRLKTHSWRRVNWLDNKRKKNKQIKKSFQLKHVIHETQLQQKTLIHKQNLTKQTEPHNTQIDRERQSLSLSLPLPRVTLEILLCLTPADFTRQRETPWEWKG